MSSYWFTIRAYFPFRVSLVSRFKRMAEKLYLECRVERRGKSWWTAEYHFYVYGHDQLINGYKDAVAAYLKKVELNRNI